MADYRGLVSDISPITQLLSRAGQERRAVARQGALTDLLGRARGGDQSALNALLVQSPEAYEQLHAENLLADKNAAISGGNQAYAVYQAPAEQRRGILTTMANDARNAGNEEMFYEIMNMVSMDDAALQAELVNDMGIASSYGWKAPISKTYSQQGAEDPNLYQDESNNLFRVRTVYDQNTGSYSDVVTPIGHDEKQAGALRVASKAGLTAAEDAEAARQKKEAEEKAVQQAALDKAKLTQLGKDAAMAARTAQSSAKTLRGANRIYDKAISAIKKGARSGAFQQYLPTLRSETIELQNAIREAGLNTISGVTLGAISKPELELALAVDIPEGMGPEALEQYLTEKKAANIKLIKELNKMGSFLSKKGNTVADWNDRYGGETTLEGALGESSAQPAPARVMRFDSEGNIIQ